MIVLAASREDERASEAKESGVNGVFASTPSTLISASQHIRTTDIGFLNSWLVMSTKALVTTIRLLTVLLFLIIELTLAIFWQLWLLHCASVAEALPFLCAICQ